ncbi:T-complex protein 11-like protein 1 isoform X2 [Lutzomyia longipalpis]|nr:T-complex protein 11-like protein 1 isoform X2 [Lutzomyia longipalpis]
MHSSGSDGNSSDNFSSSPGASSTMSRERTDSESSDKQARFVLPGMAGSPPKVLTMNEVVDCMKNIQNMTLAHEIAINPEFKLEPFEPPENSLERRVKDMVHRAFWDVLREELSSDPPCYDRAIHLLTDIKDYFEHIFLQNNVRILQRISEVLDANLIRQQAEQGILDFRSYANFLIDIMAKSCAPVRDEQVAKLKDIEDVVDLFRGIMETLTVMRLDVANCLLQAARGDVIANSVEYEKQKFKEYLKVYTAGFPATEGWLKRNITTTSSAPAGEATTGTPTKHTIVNAYLELLDWQVDNEFPELLLMDKERIETLQKRINRLCACTTVMALASGVPSFAQNPNMKGAFAREVEILLQDVHDEGHLVDSMENIWLHMKGVIEKHQRAPLESATEDTLKTQILQAARKDSPVRGLIWKRFTTYLRMCLYSKSLPPTPPGFMEFANELEAVSNSFKSLTSYNYSVYGEVYQEMLTKIDTTSS